MRIKASDTSNPLALVSFVCPECKHKFECAPDEVEDSPERAWHPWSYFCACQECDGRAKQAGWQQGMMATFGKHTGPKTSEGKRIVTKNIDGHPTQEESLRTRFNAMQHGLRSKVATYFPAKPGSYPHCDTCHIDHDECAASVACMKRTELYMRHRIAFETKDPDLLTDIRADLQASVQAIIEDIILSIVTKGVLLETPQWYYDKDGFFHLAEYVNSDGEKQLLTEVSANPLLKILTDLIAKNSLSLGDMDMTTKAVNDQELVKGQLESDTEDKEQSLAIQQKQLKVMEGLEKLVQRGRARSDNDPVLIEHSEAVRG